MDIIQILQQHDIFIKIGVAAALSLVIGLERELKKKPVGLKTSMVIACFSCLLTVISIETAYTTPARDDVNITMDPLRLAAQIVSGIGFLGAGVILRKGNDSISGLTTAAMIWGAAGIGIAVGAGFYWQAALTVLVIVIGIELIAPLVIKFGPKRLRMHEGTLKVSVNETEVLHDLREYLVQQQLKIESFSLKDVTLNDTILHEVSIRFSSSTQSNTLDLYTDILALPYVEQVALEYIH
ncbi:MAG: MgtC/SapB family protein [Lysinibacillus sp.]